MLPALALLGLFMSVATLTSPVSAASASSSYSLLSATQQLSADDCKSLDNCGVIETYINPAINVMSIIFGVVVVISIVIGGIQYSSSAGDPNKVAAARKRITNSLLSLVAFIFLYAIIDFLLPGGILK